MSRIGEVWQATVKDVNDVTVWLVVSAGRGYDLANLETAERVTMSRIVLDTAFDNEVVKWERIA